MKHEYYINYKIDNEQIIDAETLRQAEHGKNYLNPNDFMFLCEAENMHEAEQYYRREQALTLYECNHP